MINAAGGFYGARINAAELGLKATTADASLTLEADKANQQSELSQIEYNIKAFLAQAQALATIATALTNNIRASAGSEYRVSGT